MYTGLLNSVNIYHDSCLTWTEQVRTCTATLNGSKNMFKYTLTHTVTYAYPNCLDLFDFLTLGESSLPGRKSSSCCLADRHWRDFRLSFG